MGNKKNANILYLYAQFNGISPLTLTLFDGNNDIVSEDSIQSLRVEILKNMVKHKQKRANIKAFISLDNPTQVENAQITYFDPNGGISRTESVQIQDN